HAAELFEQFHVASPAIRFGEDEQVEDGSIGGAIVGSEWNLMKVGQLAKANFVQNLAWLSITPVVALLGLVLGQAFEGASGKAGRDQHILQRDGQAVATKEGDEPGNACGGHPGFI